MTLFNKILNKKLESSKTYSKELRQAVNCSQSTISKYKNEPDSEIDSFQGMLDIVRYMDEEKEFEIMTDYARHANPNKQTARYMLEYMLCNRLLDDMNELLTRMEKETSSSLNKEYIKVYRLQYNRHINLIDTDAQLEELKNVKEKDPVLKVLTKIIRCYAYYDKDHYKMLLEIVEGLLDEIEELKEEYIKKAFKAKYYEIMSFLNLWLLNDHAKAMECASIVIDLNVGKTYNAYAGFIAGYSNFFKSYKLTKKFLEDSKNTYGNIGRTEGVEFVEIALEMLDVHYKLKNNGSFIAKKNELYFKAINNIQIEDLEESKELLGEGFYLLIKGITEDNTDFLMGSMIEYLREGNGFYSNFAKNELLKRGYSEYILEKLHKINVA